MGAWILAVGMALAVDATVEVGEIVVATDAQDTAAQAQAALVAGRFVEAAGLYQALAEAGGGAQARLAQAVALYELGELNGARRAVDEAVRLEPKDPAVLNVLGLLQVDGGSVKKGVETLKASKAAARSAGRKGSEARAGVNLALAYVDLGDATTAAAEAKAAAALATEIGDTDLATAAHDASDLVAALGGTDTEVGALLGKGQTATARSHAEAAVAAARTPRQELVASLALAAVERAEGRLEDAGVRLGAAAKKAREQGLVREHAVALVDLGLVQSLGARGAVAEDTLRAAARAANAGGYKVVEVDARCELGLVLVAREDLAAAEVEARAAGVLLADMQYSQGAARQAELGGVLAARRGDLATAKSALGKAAAYYAGKGRNLDAARAQTALAGAWQQGEPGGADAAGKQAEAYFAAAGDKLGPAHVKLARALGDARARRLPEALAGFAQAAAAAEKVGGGRATALARVAREDAAATLVMLGHDQDLAKLASEAGLGDLVAREESMRAAATRYDTGLAAYTAGRFDDARVEFAAAQGAFDSLGEKELALRARRSAAWSAYNGLVAVPTAKALPSWQALVVETGKVEDPELYSRAYGAAVMVSVAEKQPDLGARLRECTNLAEKAGLGDVGARCHGALAEAEGVDLAERATHAREAYRLDPNGTAGTYALYAVAVDAYNADDCKLATELVTLGRARAGKLQSAFDEVSAACR